MTKFARLRVDVPVDDGVLVGQVRDHVRAFLDERGTEKIELAAHTDSNEATLPVGNGTMPQVGRIHWPAVVVVIYSEPPRPAPVVKPTAKPRRTQPAEGQSNG